MDSVLYFKQSFIFGTQDIRFFSYIAVNTILNIISFDILLRMIPRHGISGSNVHGCFNFLDVLLNCFSQLLNV